MAESQLYQFLEEAGLLDMWRAWNLDTQQYSCFSSSYSTLSRIDMALVSGKELQVVKNIVYLPRGVLDHSLLVVSVNLDGKGSPGVYFGLN